MPPLRQACLDFESEAKSLSMKRKSTSLVLARHTRLLEILELPQLVETCVRNGHYDEALELRQYASRYELFNVSSVVEFLWWWILKSKIFSCSNEISVQLFFNLSTFDLRKFFDLRKISLFPKWKSILNDVWFKEDFCCSQIENLLYYFENTMNVSSSKSAKI